VWHLQEFPTGQAEEAEEEEEEEEEGLFRADAVNEEDPERDRATRLPRCRRLFPPRYTPEGDSPGVTPIPLCYYSGYY